MIFDLLKIIRMYTPTREFLNYKFIKKFINRIRITKSYTRSRCRLS